MSEYFTPEVSFWTGYFLGTAASWLGMWLAWGFRK